MKKQIITIAVIAAVAAPVAAIAATDSTIAGADAAAIAIAAPTTNTAKPTAPGFYIHAQHIPADTIKQTVINFGAAAISFTPPAPQKSMPSIMLAGMPDKAAALKLTRAVSYVYRRDGKPFVASAECVSPKGHRYMYSFTYTPHATGHHAIWQNVNGRAVTKQIADACPAADLIVSINPAKN